MGGGRGGSYEPSSSFRLESNLTSLGREFPRSPSGLFGKPGIGSSSRHIESSDPARTAEHFFRRLSRGARTEEEKSPGVFRSIFKDGSHVVFRPRKSSDGSPVVEIISMGRQTGNVRRQKIHFVQEGKK